MRTKKPAFKDLPPVVGGIEAALADKASAAHLHTGVYAAVAEISAAISAHELGFPHGGVADWADITNKPTEFPPETHAHIDLAPLVHTHTGVYEPANSNIQTHVASAHAPSNAQKNSDITKAEIEAKLTGEISSHTHAGGGGGPTIKSGLVNLAAGGSSVVVFGTPFGVGVVPRVVVCSQFNGSDTSTTLFAHTITNVGFTLKGAGNALGDVAWIATDAAS